MISGFATPEGTKAFAENSSVNPSNFNKFQELYLSNVGVGTYLGDPDSKTDDLVINAVKQSMLTLSMLFCFFLVLLLETFMHLVYEFLDFVCCFG